MHSLFKKCFQQSQEKIMQYFKNKNKLKYLKYLLLTFIFTIFTTQAQDNIDYQSFSTNESVINFVDELVEKYPQLFQESAENSNRLNKNSLLNAFSKITKNNKVIRYVNPPKQSKIVASRSWKKYRKRFINSQNIQNGLKFWRKNKSWFDLAEQTYGVPAEIILGIIGVETRYGTVMGNFSIFESLASLAFYSPRRAEFFKKELEAFILLCQENNLDLLSQKGSYAGAIGIGQFMPSSIHKYAVDFDKDGKIDLINSQADAIGSVASFLNKHGWQNGQPVAFPINLNGHLPQSWLDYGVEPKINVNDLKQLGMQTLAPDDSVVSLVDLVDFDSKGNSADEYWVGLRNFYTITRYNRSYFYAMSVFQLGESIKAANK